MTSKLTRERIELIANFHRAMTLPPSHAEIEELARMALAAMDSEPVAYIFKHPAGRLFWSLTDKSNKGHDDVMPVYASPQPAPVVPAVSDELAAAPQSPGSEPAKDDRDHQLCRRCNDGIRGGCSSCAYNVR
ncbi:Uncharacterised protein [Klebsiella pneumoniae]|uniref:hypothetical protein n=1 Tax=Klebsiella pneumoniae TaxID=573 RepID=UPI0007CA1EB0|nr:hypothetical protein DB355_24015 [Klebsiella pneumoniae]SAR95910.1 Uncharacterised protein [Klebsiella pneumoniae]SAS25185.1 Uncharacterised protein [Klebsiella pneumoniae]SAS61309.1 Uncharacterised protein [Klebsiella pneumoniae]SAS65555.1 Uncharacterised protein [Klebsiella pneumoniae]